MSRLPNTNCQSARRVSMRQLEMLWEFLNSNRDVALAYNRKLQAKEYSKAKWREVAFTLNAESANGAIKEGPEWSKYWVDYKAKLKKRVSSLRIAQAGTGGGPSEVPTLSEIEEKYLVILGEDFGQGLAGVQVNPLPDMPNIPPPEDSESVCIIPPQEGFNPPEEINTLPPEGISSQPPEGTNTLPPEVINTLPPIRPDLQPGPIRHSRRERRRQTMTQTAARQALVEAAKQKAEAIERVATALEGILTIAQKLEHILNNE